MRLFRLVLLTTTICFVAAPAAPQNLQQQPSANPKGGAPVIRTESQLVVVDAVITDKKGNHLGDLAPREFHIFEDNVEQSVKSVTQESATGTQPASPTHTVLLLGRMDSSELIYVRDKVGQFVTDYASPARLVAIINYLDAGNVKVMQGFTADPARLKQALTGLKGTGVVVESTTPEHSDEVFSGAPPQSPFRDTGETTDFTGRNLLAAVRNLAKNLGSVPGRKALVLMAPTFDYNLQPHDFPSTVDACNKSNVAVYTVDIRSNSNSLIENTLEPLVSGTGGFMDDVPNDAPRALQRIAQEQDDRYVISYAPSKSQDDICHRIRVKVDRSDATIRARSAYCTVKPNDPLAGSEAARSLEARAASNQPGNLAATMQVGYFYTAPEVVRVHVAAEVPTSSLVFDKQNGKLHATLNVLGVAFGQDGTLKARFTDAVDLDFDNKDQLNLFKRRPYLYQKQFAVATGSYNFTLVVGAGRDDFARLQAPLIIDPNDGKHLGLSGLAICRDLSAPPDSPNGAISLLSENVPLVSRGTQFIPAGSTHLKKTDNVGVYFELYEPRLKENPPTSLRFRVRVFDSAGALKNDSETMSVPLAKWTDPVIPVGWKIAVDKLAAGSYSLQVIAVDSNGGAPLARNAQFEMQ